MNLSPIRDRQKRDRQKPKSFPKSQIFREFVLGIEGCIGDIQLSNAVYSSCQMWQPQQAYRSYAISEV